MKQRFLSTVFLVILTMFLTANPLVVSAMAINAQEITALNAAAVIRVPQDVGDIQTAINQISDGGIIEISAGTYNTPVGGLRINDMRKGFTIRARAGETVTLSGGGSRDLVRFINSSVANQKPVLFDGLIFSGGYSNTPGLAAGVTLHFAEATFVNCQFINNNTTMSGSGGALQISLGSTVLMINNIFSGNSAAISGAAVEIQEYSKVYIHASQFLNNRTNKPNHATYSAGGAIHIGNATARISNSRFEGNQAGYVGGAVYAIGNWEYPMYTDVKISNSTFVNNQAINDPSVPLNVPTEGGAFHAEAKVRAEIYNSRFITNTAQSGGGVNLYRATVLVEGGVFLGNRATGSGVGGGGGAINAISNDVGNEGTTNFPSSQLTVIDTYIQGRYGNVTTAAPFGGGIYVGGDTNRQYGANGTPKVGTLENNWAIMNADRIGFVDLDVSKSGGGTGGAIYTDLANINLYNSVFANNDALGSGSMGGAIMTIDQSFFKLSTSTIAKNSSTSYGGGVFAQGARLEINSSNLISNEVTSDRFGQGIFAGAADVGLPIPLPMTGWVQNSTFSNHGSVAIFDDDRQNPINSMQYNSNKFYPSSGVYEDNLAGSYNVSGLNNLIVKRTSSSTDKSTSPNTALNSAPTTGQIIGVPSKLLSSGAAGDTSKPNSYIVYGWSGGSATVNGSSVSGNSGWKTVTSAGTYTLRVNDVNFTAPIVNAPAPNAAFTANRSVYPVQLSWALTSGTFVDAMIDNHANINPAASGAVSVTPATSNAPYYLYIMTKEGGVTKQAGAANLTVRAYLPAIKRP